SCSPSPAPDHVAITLLTIASVSRPFAQFGSSLRSWALHREICGRRVTSSSISETRFEAYPRRGIPLPQFGSRYWKGRPLRSWPVAGQDRGRLGSSVWRL